MPPIVWSNMQLDCKPCIPSFWYAPFSIQIDVEAIEEMNLFLCTAFTNSFAGGWIQNKKQGMCHVNVVAPVACRVVSITIIHAHKHQHAGATFLCSISALWSSVVIDIMHLNMGNVWLYSQLGQPPHCHQRSHQARKVLIYSNKIWRHDEWCMGLHQLVRRRCIFKSVVSTSLWWRPMQHSTPLSPYGAKDTRHFYSTKWGLQGKTGVHASSGSRVGWRY